MASTKRPIPDTDAAWRFSVERRLNDLARAHVIADDVPGGPAGGDLSGTYPNPRVSQVFSLDTRSVATSPADYSQIAKWQFKNRSAVGNPGSSGTFCTLLGMRAWVDDSGGRAHEIAYLDDSTVFHRSGTTASGWGAWQQIAQTDALGIYTFVVNQWHKSSDNQQRFQFANNGATYIKGSAITFRNATDQDIGTIGSTGVFTPVIGITIPASGIERRPGWSGAHKRRWIKNALADISHRRFSILFASRDNSAWNTSEGFIITVRTGYYSGGSYAKCLVTGGYQRPWKLLALEARGPHAFMPQISNDALVSGNIYQCEVFLSLSQYFGVTVEIEYSEDFTEQAWGAAFTAGNQLQINPDGRTTTLVSDPGWFWWDQASINKDDSALRWQAPSFQNGWANLPAGSGGDSSLGYLKDKAGVVHLRGIITSGSAATITTLPAGCRPGNTKRIAIVADTGPITCSVLTDGQVQPSIGRTGGGWIALDGISYLAEL